MHSEELENILQRRPFRPFRLTVTTGEGFDVLHPDMAIVDERFVAIGVAPSESTEQDEMIVYWIDLQHVVHIRRLERPSD
jgi:hypothetical protein